MGYTPKYARANSRVSPLGAVLTVVIAVAALVLTTESLVTDMPSNAPSLSDLPPVDSPRFGG